MTLCHVGKGYEVTEETHSNTQKHMLLRGLNDNEVFDLQDFMCVYTVCSRFASQIIVSLGSDFINQIICGGARVLCRQLPATMKNDKLHCPIDVLIITF